MRLLFADRFPQAQRQRLGELGHDVTYEPEVGSDGLADLVADHDVLVVRSTRVPDDVVAAGTGLQLIIRAGSGTDTIASDAAAARGVAVCNVPGRNAIAVAELAFALLLAIDRRLPDQVADLRAGRWRKQEYQQAGGIAGRHVGIIGLGDIGLAFAERAAAFGCRLHAVERSSRAPATQERVERLGIDLVTDLEALATTCDVLSFHVPLRPDTRALIGPPLLDHVGPGTILINTARGELVDEDALLAAIDAKDLRVGLDVYPDEPSAGTADYTSRLAAHPRVYGTHHVGASTDQAQDAIADEVVDMVEAFSQGEVRHQVNDVELTSSERR